MNAAADATEVGVTIGLFEVELGAAELEGTLLEVTGATVEVGSTSAAEAEDVAVLMLVTVIVVVIVDVAVTMSSSAWATSGASGTNMSVTF